MRAPTDVWPAVVQAASVINMGAKAYLPKPICETAEQSRACFSASHGSD